MSWREDNGSSVSRGQARFTDLWFPGALGSKVNSMENVPVLSSATTDWVA